MGTRRRLSLLRPGSYHLPFKNCGDELHIRTGWGWPRESLSGPAPSGALDRDLNLSIWSGYGRFLAL